MQSLKEFLESEPNAGPKPRSISEFIQKPKQKITKKTTRGGKKIKLFREIAHLKISLNMTNSAEQQQLIVKKIKELKESIKNHKKESKTTPHIQEQKVINKPISVETYRKRNEKLPQ